MDIKTVDDNLIKSSIERALLNNLFETQKINEEMYHKVKESIVNDYGLKKLEI